MYLSYWFLPSFRRSYLGNKRELKIDYLREKRRMRMEERGRRKDTYGQIDTNRQKETTDIQRRKGKVHKRDIFTCRLDLRSVAPP